MQRERLTKRTIDAIEPNAADCIVWDSELSGFGIRIRAGGSRTFIAQYRAGGGRTGQTRRYTIGRFGVMTVDEARLEARKVLLSAAQGGDPAGTRHARRKEMTIAELVTHFEREGSGHMKPRSKRYALARLKNHIVPLIGSRKISSVRASDVEAMMRAIRDGKTARDVKTGRRARVIVQGGDAAASRAVRDLSAVFNFAIRQELAAHNPTVQVKKAPIKRRTRFLSQNELERLGQALGELERSGANPKAIAIMRLWALTGCRRDEIAGLKWSEVDFENRCLVLEDSKTGRSVRPLAAPAIELIRAQSNDDRSPYVFPAEGDAATFYQGTKRYWRKVVKLADLPGVTPHTLRHTIGSAAVSSGESLPMTGAILGHANQQSTSIYAHMQQDPARRAAERIVAPIATALGVSKAAEVCPLPLRKAAS